MCELQLQKKWEGNTLGRKQARTLLFHRNRSYFKRHLALFEVQSIDPGLDYSPSHHQHSHIHAQFRTIIDAFPRQAFCVQQFPKLIRVLDSTLLIEQCKSVIGIDFLAHFLKDQQIRNQVLSQNLIEKLFRLLPRDCSLLILRSLSILRKVSSALNEELQFHTFMNWQKVDFLVLLELVSSESVEIRKQCLMLIESLLERKFRFQAMSHKLKLLQKLSLLAQDSLSQGSAGEFELVFRLIQKNGLNFGNEQFNQIQIACLIKLKLLQKLSNTQLYQYALARITKSIVSLKSLKQLNKKLAKTPFSHFHSLYPHFITLTQLLFFKQTLINDSKAFLFQQTQLIKLLSYRHIYAFFEHLGLLPKIRFSLLNENALQHSQNWSIAISCLTLIQKLLQKNYKSFLDWLSKDFELFVKIEELYSVHDEYLHRQLNSTLNSMIKANPHYLAYRLKLYFQSLNEYGKNTVKKAISLMKKSIESLRKDPLSPQNENLWSMIKKEANIVYINFQRLALKGRSKSQVERVISSYLSGLVAEA